MRLKPKQGWISGGCTHHDPACLSLQDPRKDLDWITLSLFPRRGGHHEYISSLLSTFNLAFFIGILKMGSQTWLRTQVVIPQVHSITSILPSKDCSHLHPPTHTPGLLLLVTSRQPFLPTSINASIHISTPLSPLISQWGSYDLLAFKFFNGFLMTKTKIFNMAPILSTQATLGFFSSFQRIHLVPSGRAHFPNPLAYKLYTQP